LFTIRVELHTSATANDYAQLHLAMETRGFLRKIKASDGSWYALPQAEYRFESNAQLEQVLESAKAAAATIERPFSVFVSQATACMWFNLPQL
jgi:hypothetical protein